MGQQMFGQLMLQAKDLCAERTGVIATLVVRGREVLLQPVPVIEDLAALVAHHLLLLGRRTLQRDAHVLKLMTTF
jgi:hypothetical protein